jgi:hypothetical protein
MNHESLSKSEGSGIALYMFLGSLLLIRKGVGALIRLPRTLTLRSDSGISRQTTLLFLFATACVVSMTMPLFINGRLLIADASILTDAETPLRLSPGNLTSVLVLVFCILFAVYIAHENTSPQIFAKTIRVYLASGIFISLWGLVQCVLYLLHIPYPASVFNNNASPGTFQYLGEVGSTFRLYSVTNEPSYLATVLVSMLPIFLYAAYRKHPVFGPRRDRLAMALIFIVLLLTESSTGFIGLFTLCLFLPHYSHATGASRLRVLATLGGLALIMLISYVAIPPVHAVVQQQLITKSDTQSALERGKAVYYDTQYFLQYPILGVGWGSATSHDLIMGLLAGCGLVGFVPFALLIAGTVSRLRRNAVRAGRLPAAAFSWSGMIVVPLIVILACKIVSTPLGTDGSFWIILGLAIAAGAVDERAASEGWVLVNGNNGGLSRG